MKVKVCGITNLEDAHAAVEAGADALGFIFTQLSPRYTTPGVVREIIQTLPPFITPVGVFVNRKRDEINDIVAITGIRCIQFHGEESPVDMVGYSVPVYRAFRVREGFDVSLLERYPTRTFLIDGFNGGTNSEASKTSEWRTAIAAKKFGRVILSGGLTPTNVHNAIAAVRPYAIDVNGGVEASPGKKDKEKLKELFAAVRTAKVFT